MKCGWCGGGCFVTMSGIWSCFLLFLFLEKLLLFCCYFSQSRVAGVPGGFARIVYFVSFDEGKKT